MMYDMVKLELMVPCRFDSLKNLHKYFCHDLDQMAFQEPHKTYFSHFDGVNINF